MDESIVVSEIGEQWSPNTAPVRTAPMEAIMRGVTVSVALDTAAAIGITMGMSIVLVPHEVPVAKAITMAIAKTKEGRIFPDNIPFVISTSHWASPISVTTDFRAKARASIITATSMDLTPPIQASIDCFKLSSLLVSPVTIAAIELINAAHVNTTDASASPNASLIDLPDSYPLYHRPKIVIGMNNPIGMIV